MHHNQKKAMPVATKRMVIMDESVNRYGYNLVAAGGDLSGYNDNPVLLLNHNLNSLPIGRLTEIKLEGTSITALPEFDDDDDEAMRVFNKYEKGYIKTCSIGFDIHRINEDQDLKKNGLQGATVHEWELLEVSLVAVPANKNARKLTYDVSDDIQLKIEDKALNPNPQQRSMNQVLKTLGLADDATEQQAVDAITGLQNQMLQRDVETLVLAAKAKGQLSVADAESSFRTLAATNLSAAQQFVKSMTAAAVVAPAAVLAAPVTTEPVAAPVTLMSRVASAQQLGAQVQVTGKENWNFKDWSQKDPDGLLAIKQADPAKYKELTTAYTGK